MPSRIHLPRRIASRERIPFCHRTPWITKRVTGFWGSARFAGILAGMIAAAAPCSAAERWTSLNGNSTVEAEFIGMWGSNVVLELPGPRRVSVNVDDLIAESRIQARRMAEEQRTRRTETKQQILAEAKEAAAPAPNPLPQPPAPPAYQPFSGTGPLAQLEWLDQQERNGHSLLAAFDSLPASYQSDLERLLRISVAKLDMQGTRQVIGSVHSVGELIITRQRWLFSHPRLGAIDETAKNTLESLLLSIGGLIRDGLDPDQLKLEEIATTPLRQWIVEFDQRIAPHEVALRDQFQSLGIDSVSYEVLQEKEGTATVERTMGTDKQSVSMVNVEGKWLWADLDAEKWAEIAKNWEESMAGTADGSVLAGGQAQLAAVLISGYMQPAMNAKTAREFHAVMDGWIMQASPLIAQMGNLNLGGRGQNGYAGDDYDGMGDYYDEGDMGGMEDDLYDQQMNMSGGSSGPPRSSGQRSSSGPGPGMSSGPPSGMSGGPGMSSGPPRGSSRPSASSGRPGMSSGPPSGSSRPTTGSSRPSATSGRPTGSSR